MSNGFREQQTTARLQRPAGFGEKQNRRRHFMHDREGQRKIHLTRQIGQPE